jgi:flavin-dependent dehydrogenase
MKGGVRPGDERFEVITGRRAVVESVTGRVTEETPRVTVRRGGAVEGLATGAAARGGVPHATGVELEGGERIEADLLLDTTGRRSPLPRWIADAGGTGVREELDDSGFVYYGRHFRSEDGSLPVMLGPLKQDYGSISALTLPADNGTWSVTIIGSAKDRALRRLSDPKRWEAAVQLLPLAAHWIDGQPIDDGVTVMAKIEDRIRDFSPNGNPVITGVLAVGDSWSCTNPSLGRGASIGLMHGVALRDLLRDQGAAGPWELASMWYELTRADMEPWYRSTLNYDRHRLAEVHAIIQEEDFSSSDPDWVLIKTLEARSQDDPDLLRLSVDMAMLLRHSGEVLEDPAVQARLDLNGGSSGGGPPLGPSRAELVSAIA